MNKTKLPIHSSKPRNLEILTSSPERRLRSEAKGIKNHEELSVESRMLLVVQPTHRSASIEGGTGHLPCMWACAGRCIGTQKCQDTSFGMLCTSTMLRARGRKLQGTSIVPRVFCRRQRVCCAMRVGACALTLSRAQGLCPEDTLLCRNLWAVWVHRRTLAEGLCRPICGQAFSLRQGLRKNPP